MKALLRAVAFSSVVVLGMASFSGCATQTGKPSTPCESCTYGYVPVGKSSERRVWCVKDGKTLDCMKKPAECPECAKQMMAPK